MDDGYELTLQGLLRKRSYLAGQVEAHRSQLAQLLLFKPEIDLGDLPERPVPPPNAAFRGEVQRFLLHTLRTAGKRMTTTELAQQVMAARRLDPRDRILAKLIERRTGNSLRRLRAQGWIDSGRYSLGAEQEWWVTPKEGEPGGYANGSTVGQAG